MKIWLNALRVRQWSKQALIILPLIALGDKVEVLDLGRAFVVAVAFSLIASSVYVFNDLKDLIADKQDTVKSKRPFAAGAIDKNKGKIVGIILCFVGFLCIFLTSGQNRLQASALSFIYLSSNLLYSQFNLKKFYIIGLSIVSLGFAIRFSIGTFVLELPFSFWAFILIIQLSMFMLSGKRFQTALRDASQRQTQDSKPQFWLLSMVTFAAFFAATYSGFISDPDVVSVWGKETLIISVLPLSVGLVRFVELVTHPEKYLQADVTESMTKDLLLVILVMFFAITLFMGRIISF